MKKLFALILVFALCFSICACGTDSSDSDSGSTKITSSMQAVNRVKNGDSWTSAGTEIRMDLGFKFNKIYDPDYGSCTAKENSDGSWDVTLKGNMSGYIDDYNEDFETYSFTYTVTIDSDGEVKWSSGRTVKEN